MTNPCSRPLSLYGRSRWLPCAAVLVVSAACSPHVVGPPAPPPGLPIIGVSTTSVSFSAAAGGSNPIAQTVAITNVGLGTLSGLGVGTILYQPIVSGWLSSTLSGNTSAPSTLVLSATTSGLLPGTYTAAVPVVTTVTGVLPQNIIVTFTVAPVPIVSLSPHSDTVTATVGGGSPAAQTFSVSNAGNGTLSGLTVGTVVYGTAGSGWITASINSPTAPATLTVQATTGALAVGTYTALVPVISSVAGVVPDSVFETFIVTATAVPPRIALSPTTVSFSANAGGGNPPSSAVSVSNNGGGTLTGLTVGTIKYGAGASNWLGATLAGTTAPTTLTLQPTTGALAPGSYTATVPISGTGASNNPRNVTVNFTVAGQQGLVLTPSNLSFVGTVAAASPAPQTLTITNSGAGVLAGLAAGAVIYPGGQPTGWLQVAISGTSTPAVLTLSAITGGLAAGTYTATVPISTTSPGVSSQGANVSFTLAAGSGSMVILQGDQQTGFVDSILPVLLKVRVYDGAGNPKPGVTVTWTVNNGGALLNTVSTTTSLGESSTQWRLGPIAGIQTVQVTSPGVSPLTFIGDALLPSVAGQYPNEPPGYIRFAELNMSALPNFPRSTAGALAGAWYAYPQGDPDLLVVTPDLSAPQSPPNVFSVRFKLGLPGGAGPVNFGGWDVGTSAQGQRRAAYLSMWIKIVGADFENQSFGTKLGFLEYGPQASNQISQGIWLLKNNNGVQEVESNWKMTFYEEFLGVPGQVNRILQQNKTPLAVMTAGTWHHWETVVVKNTVGQADGVFNWWIDGTQIIGHNDVVWVTSVDTTGFLSFKFNPTWGGSGGARTRDDFLAIDHIYLSGIH